MQLYIVQFKQYQGIILIILKYVDNSKLQDDNCSTVLRFLLPQRQKKAIFISKSSSSQQGDMKQFNHDKCTVKNF